MLLTSGMCDGGLVLLHMLSLLKLKLITGLAEHTADGRGGAAPHCSGRAVLRWTSYSVTTTQTCMQYALQDYEGP